MNTYGKYFLPVLFGSLCIFSLDASAQIKAVTEISKAQQAADAYEKNHWVDAFTTYAYLADAGHADAARIASQMWKYGVPLYATEFLATPAQLKRWLSLQ
jgi:hypothetical protein